MLGQRLLVQSDSQAGPAGELDVALVERFGRVDQLCAPGYFPVGEFQYLEIRHGCTDVRRRHISDRAGRTVRGTFTSAASQNAAIFFSSSMPPQYFTSGMAMS